MTETKQTSTTKTDRRPDCVTEIRMGNSSFLSLKQSPTGNGKSGHSTRPKKAIVTVYAA